MSRDFNTPGTVFTIGIDRKDNRNMKSLEVMITTRGCFDPINHIGRSNLGTGKGHIQLHIDKEIIYAHRWMYREYVGEIYEGLSVLHRCDNPRCISPAHLYLGTQKQNVLDRNAKNRHVDTRGSKHPRASIDESKARLIKDMLEETTLSNRKIGQFLAVSIHVINDISRGKTWRHI